MSDELVRSANSIAPYGETQVQVAQDQGPWFAGVPRSPLERPLAAVRRYKWIILAVVALIELNLFIQHHQPGAAGTSSGEGLVIWGDGALDFPALLQRMASTGARAHQLATTRPANYVVFDLLALDGSDLRREPLRVRRRLLERILSDAQPSLLLSLAIILASVSRPGREKVFIFPLRSSPAVARMPD